MPSLAANFPSVSGDRRKEKVKKKELTLAASALSEEQKKKKKKKNRERKSGNEVEKAMNGYGKGLEPGTAKRKSSKSAGYEPSPKRSKQKNWGSDGEEEEEREEEEDEEPSSELEQDPNAVSNFGISDALREKLKSKGIESLFPIQAMTFETIFSGSDLVGRARTGQKSSAPSKCRC